MNKFKALGSFLLGISTVFVVGCEATVSNEDSGTRGDAGQVRDAGSPNDGGVFDAGLTEVDAGADHDAGTSDAGGSEADSGADFDAGSDSGVTDAGLPDSGAEDSGVADAGFDGGIDAGVDGGTDGGVTSAKRLSVSGRNLLDPKGKTIVLRGYNWGQWATAQPQDATDNLAQGANSVRVPLRWWGDWKDNVDSYSDSAPGHIDPDHLALLDQSIQWAVAKKLWVVVFVDSNNGQGANNTTDHFWSNTVMRQKFIEVWRFLVQRYQQTPYIAAYEILPEPRADGVTDQQIRDFYAEVIAAIRTIDQVTPVIVGPGDAYDLRKLESAYTTVDPNVVYTGDYFIFGHELARIDDIQNFVNAHDVPVWVNQVGIQSGDPDAGARASMVLDALNTNNVGWAWWTYRVNSTNGDGHGIFYLDASDGGWVEKTDWYDLVGSFLPQ